MLLMLGGVHCRVCALRAAARTRTWALGSSERVTSCGASGAGAPVASLPSYGLTTSGCCCGSCFWCLRLLLGCSSWRGGGGGSTVADGPAGVVGASPADVACMRSPFLADGATAASFGSTALHHRRPWQAPPTHPPTRPPTSSLPSSEEARVEVDSSEPPSSPTACCCCCCCFLSRTSLEMVGRDRSTGCRGLGPGIGGWWRQG
jgi:hypothetical protein